MQSRGIWLGILMWILGWADCSQNLCQKRAKQYPCNTIYILDISRDSPIINMFCITNICNLCTTPKVYQPTSYPTSKSWYTHHQDIFQTYLGCLECEHGEGTTSISWMSIQFQWPENFPRHLSYFCTCFTLFKHCRKVHSSMFIECLYIEANEQVVEHEGPMSLLESARYCLTIKRSNISLLASVVIIIVVNWWPNTTLRQKRVPK